jgi:monoamine oxidase
MGKFSKVAVILTVFMSFFNESFADDMPMQQEGEANCNRHQVIVIGAGIAGLAAADSLRNRGYDVIVLEARGRIGGRIWTDRSLGIPLDMGAAYLEGADGNPIDFLVRHFCIETVVGNLDDEQFYNACGEELSDAKDEQLDRDIGDFKEYLHQVQKRLGCCPDYPISVAYEDFITQRRECLTYEDQLALRTGINIGLEGTAAANIDQLSLAQYDKDLAFSGDNLMFPGGFDQVPKRLAEGLQIHYGQVVSAIDYDSIAVSVTTREGKQYTADYVIVTVPLGVLKSRSITFTPELPSWKQMAIDRLGMGVADKLFLRFPKVFWKKDKDSEFVGFISHCTLWSGFINYFAYIEKPVVLFYNIGNEALQTEDLSDREAIDKAMTMLRTIYHGKNIPNPTGYALTRWARDPFTLGSYSYIPVGGKASDYDVMAMSVGRVLFAGEATERRYPATVHGAYWSGRRVAHEVCR